MHAKEQVYTVVLNWLPSFHLTGSSCITEAKVNHNPALPVTFEAPGSQGLVAEGLFKNASPIVKVTNT